MEHEIPTHKYFVLQAETDDLYKKIAEYEDATKEANGISDKFDADIRDSSKRVQKLECSMEETMEKLQQSVSKMEEAEKEFKDKDDDVNAAARRCVLMEEELRIQTEKLAVTIFKLANMSKEADKIVKGMREWENKTMNNEVEIEDLDKKMREARRIGNHKKLLNVHSYLLCCARAPNAKFLPNYELSIFQDLTMR